MEDAVLQQYMLMASGAISFALEIISFLILLVLTIATFRRYSIIDFKDKIYVFTVRFMSLMSGLSIANIIIIKNGIKAGLGFVNLDIFISMIMMVAFWYFVNIYVYEIIHEKNKRLNKMMVVYFIPTFCMFLVLITNAGLHRLFDVSFDDNGYTVQYGSWYVIPFSWAIISIFMTIITIMYNIKTVIEKKLWVVFVVVAGGFTVHVIQYMNRQVIYVGAVFALFLFMFYVFLYARADKIDYMTHLPNHASFKKRLKYLIGFNRNLVVAVVAIDDLNHINREYGARNTTDIIKVVATYLADNAPKKEAMRISTTEFAILLEDYTVDEAKEWSDKIIKRFNDEWTVKKVSVNLTPSVIMVPVPEMGTTPYEILDMIDFLHGIVKKDKDNSILCEKKHVDMLERKNKITNVLKDVTKNGHMYVQYQPILDVKDNMFTRGEALFRLSEDELGEISPGEFFPIAEENGYVVEVGYVLIDKVCEYIRSWDKIGMQPPIISVNFSRQQIMADNLEGRLNEILTKHGLRPGAIAIEIPEDVFSVQYEDVKNRIVTMHDHGFRFYLDRFSGVLDVTRLMDIPFEIIKINKNLIWESSKRDSVYLFTSAMTAVFAENGIKILGDGIESDELKETADLLFMDFLQGYFFGRPMGEDDATEQFKRTSIVDTDSKINELIEDKGAMEKMLADIDDTAELNHQAADLDEEELLKKILADTGEDDEI